MHHSRGLSMQPESGLDRSFLLCELAAILAFMASAPLVALEPTISDPDPGQSTKREPITYELVHGSKRLSLGGFPSSNVTWLDDEKYLQRESAGWKVVDAATGQQADWYDQSKLSAALQNVEGVSETDAHRMAEGGWIESINSLRTVVFHHKDQLIRITLEGEDISIVGGVPEKLELSTLSPTGSGLAFIRDNELWVADFAADTLRQLTHDAGPRIRNGKADWVYFEEVYSRKWQAYRWSPDGGKLAYQQFNDTNVSAFRIADHTTVTQAFETENYPKAGEPNPTVRLGVVAMTGGDTVWMDSSSYNADDLLVTHFNWYPDGNSLYCYAQNRIQTWLDVLQCGAGDGHSHVLLRDQTAAWVENPGDVTFLSDGSFLFFSERSGWRHLYRVSSDGVNVTPVTEGEWEVRNLLAVSEDESAAIVSGTKDSHIAENAYKISLADSAGKVTRMTAEEANHSIVASTHGGFLLDSWSSLHQPPTVVLRNKDGREIRVVEEPIVIPEENYSFGNVEIKDVPMADGSATSAIFVYPPNFDSTQQYPVWLKTYAGPHAPGVKNAWSARLPEQLLANHGIVVVIFDPRSASGRGAQSAWLAYQQLGVEETKDLVSLCDWLAAESWVDAARIGLSGHSYGGYFTSYAMTHCNRLCAGIAGAPVTDWANYDTIYTERYMSTPQKNPDGYKASSVIEAAGKLQGRLLLLHGLKDDNVHPENSLQLVHALQDSGKQFDLMLYPTSRHGIYGGHYNKLVFDFILQAMGKAEGQLPK